MIPAHVVSTGARTPVGLTSPTAAAAVRAGITRLGEHPFMVDRAGDPMVGAIDGRLEPGLIGPDRFIALSKTAIGEACAPLMGWQRSTLPLYLGLPELRPGFTRDDANRVLGALSKPGALPIALAGVQTFVRGHAAGLIALAKAAADIEAGRCEACLVVGVESWFHPDTMEWLDAGRQLAGARSRSGFHPGEAAGACLVVAGPVCRRLGWPSQARIVATGLGTETKTIKTDAVPLGEGLTATVRSVVQGLGVPRRINHVICDINGERYRGEEWGFVCLRLAQCFDDPAGYQSPSDSWGDVGAASGLLFLVLACQASLRGYDKGPLTLIWASSEGGARCAVVLETGGQ